jgi:HEAT repeat protein
MKPTLTSILLVCMLVVAFICCTSQPSLEELLTRITTYQAGQSRQDLSQIEALVQQSINTPQQAHQIELQMTSFLASDASLASKQFICRQLGLIGTDYSVPVLAAMLLDSVTAEMGRYALERIPGQTVNDALRDALPRVDRNIKLGIIATLGLRRDSASVKTLAQFLEDTELDLAAAACAALGEIATDEAIQILKDASGKHSIKLQDAIHHALLSGANILQTNGKTEQAYSIYHTIYTTTHTISLRAGAMRGMLLAKPEHAGDMIVQILKKEDLVAQTAAIQTINELPAIDNLRDIAGTLPLLTGEAQIQLLAALATTEKTVLQPAIMPLLGNDRPDVRLAAIRALAKTGNHTAIFPLVQIAVAGITEEEQNAARESLYALKDERVNEVIVSELSKADAAVKIELIRVVNERRIQSARELIFSYTADDNPHIRLTAIKCLGTIATPEMLPIFLAKIPASDTPQESSAWEQSTLDVARMIPKSDKPSQAILTKYTLTDNPAEKGVLLKLLGRLRDPFSLPLIAGELKNNNTDMQYAAIQALNNWQAEDFNNESILKDLLAIARKTGEGKNQILALRGFLHLTGIIARNDQKKGLHYYQEAVPYLVQANEKRLLLSGLQTINSLDALQLAAQYLHDPDTKSEAETTILKLAPVLLPQHPAEVKAQLQQILNTSKNEQHVEEVERILKN